LSSSSDLVNTTVFFVLTAIITIILFQLSIYSYLLFHSLIELFAIVIACAVFVIGWNSKDDNNFYMFLGIAYLFIAGVDILHTLSYYGTGIFPGYDADLPTQLWILGRYIEAISLLIAPFIYKIKRKIRKEYLVLSYLVIVGLLLTSIFTLVFPQCFIMGEGLTLFKITSEFVISGILLIAALSYYLTRNNFDSTSLKWFIAAIAFTIAAEMSFTLYSHPYGLENMIGHYFRFISYYMIYKAIIEATLIRPYDVMFRSLKISEQSLIETNEYLQLTTKIVRHDIRNELSKITLAIELYQQSKKDDSLLEQVLESISRCTILIESTRQMSLAHEGRIELNPVNIGEILQQAISDSKLKISIEGDASVIAGTGLLSVFRNIIMNAENHSSSDRLDIYVSSTKDTVEIRFSDFGSGIPEEIREKIFEEGFTAGPKAGSGIGLFIAKKLIESYNGTISVESNLPKGTTFVVSLASARTS